MEGRFRIDAVAATGGMGKILRAHDLASNEAVAIKVIHADSGRATTSLELRFAREAEILGRLRHPGIVRHIARGFLDGEAWLAMDWVEGEDLEHRLAREPLTLPEALALVRGIADALAHAHTAGVVHRDLKPSNVLLVGHDPHAPRLIDFGVAHLTRESQALTHTGAVLGTVGYMSPEQASGGEVDLRSDLFSLGCIMFEVLSGRQAFSGQSPMAVLAKLLVGRIDSLRELRPDLPDAIIAACDALLARDRDGRPSTAQDLIGMLGGVAAPSESRAPQRPSLGLKGELRVYSVVIAELSSVDASSARTLTPSELEEAFVPLREAAKSFAGELSRIGPHAVALTLEGHGSARDQAAQAALAALAVKRSPLALRVAIATGQAETSGSGPTGPVLERACALLAAPLSEVGAIAVDGTTSALLGAEFDVRSNGDGALLLGRQQALAGVPAVLGRAVPCIGRERELAQLEGLIRESAEESLARVALISAAPGTGKSRLLAELVQRLERAQPELTILSIRAEAARRGSPFSLARELLRASVRGGGESLDVETFLEHLAELGIDGHTETDVAADLAGLKLPNPSALDAIRSDPLALRDAKRRAFERWICQRARKRPILFTIEDVHWADPASVALLVSAFKRAQELPVSLVMTARPEVTGVFPDLATDLAAEELRLSGLSKRAATKIARLVLGEDAEEGLVQRTVELCDGNAFYLEELLRNAVAQRTLDLPESVVAMAQVRLMRLDADARHVLRAASVFGESFTPAGVRALLGEDQELSVERLLPRLAAEEVLLEERRDHWSFRHALLRQAAYAMLTPEGRAQAHRLAGEHLLRCGDEDPAVLAHHFLESDDRPRALSWLSRAAFAALDAGSLDQACALADRGLSLSPSGEQRGLLLAVHAFASGLRGEFERSVRCCNEAWELLTRGSEVWTRVAATLAFADANRGRLEGSLPVIGALLALEQPLEPTAHYARAVATLASALFFAGQLELADRLVEGLRRASRPGEERLFTVFHGAAEGLVAAYFKGDLALALRFARASCRACVGLLDPMAAVMPRASGARMLTDCGQYDEARALAIEAEEVGARSGTPYLRDFATIVRHGLHVRTGEPCAAQDLERLAASDSPLIRAFGHLNVAAEAVLKGDRSAVAAELAQTREIAPLVMVRLIASAIEARGAFEAGEHERALESVRRAAQERGQLQGLVLDSAWLHQVEIDALLALGRVQEARESAARAGAWREVVQRGLEPADLGALEATEPMLRLGEAIARAVA